MMTFYTPVNANVANWFDNYNEKKFHARFGLSTTVEIYLIDDTTIQLNKRL